MCGIGWLQIAHCCKFHSTKQTPCSANRSPCIHVFKSFANSFVIASQGFWSLRPLSRSFAVIFWNDDRAIKVSLWLDERLRKHLQHLQHLRDPLTSHRNVSCNLLLRTIKRTLFHVRRFQSSLRRCFGCSLSQPPARCGS